MACLPCFVCALSALKLVSGLCMYMHLHEHSSLAGLCTDWHVSVCFVACEDADRRLSHEVANLHLLDIYPKLFSHLNTDDDRR